MKLTQEEVRRIRAWKEGQCCARDASRPHDTQHLEPMLPKVCLSIAARHAHKAKTARGKLKRLIRACQLILEVLP